jgi:hypothetical protein
MYVSSQSSIVLTFLPVLDEAKDDGIFIFGIGFAQVLKSEVNYLASTISIPGVQTSFFALNVSQLPNILNELVESTCIDINI